MLIINFSFGDFECVTKSGQLFQTILGSMLTFIHSTNCNAKQNIVTCINLE